LLKLLVVVLLVLELALALARMWILPLRLRVRSLSVQSEMGSAHLWLGASEVRSGATVWLVGVTALLLGLVYWWHWLHWLLMLVLLLMMVWPGLTTRHGGSRIPEGAATS
jgi:hypothetical protein